MERRVSDTITHPISTIDSAFTVDTEKRIPELLNKYFVFNYVNPPYPVPPRYVRVVGWSFFVYKHDLPNTFKNIIFKHVYLNNRCNLKTITYGRTTILINKNDAHKETMVDFDNKRTEPVKGDEMYQYDRMPVRFYSDGTCKLYLSSNTGYYTQCTDEEIIELINK